jgi:hypothetical protein
MGVRWKRLEMMVKRRSDHQDTKNTKGKIGERKIFWKLHLIGHMRLAIERKDCVFVDLMFPSPSPRPSPLGSNGI